MMAHPGRRLFIRTESPPFSIRLESKSFKKRQPVVLLEVRNSDHNKTSYDKVVAAMRDVRPEVVESLTPRRHLPSRASITFESGVLAPAAVAAMSRTMLDAVGLDRDAGILAGDDDPLSWRPRPPA